MTFEEKRGRKSAKGTVNSLANELLGQLEHPDTKAKLALIETIAHRMGWMDLYNRLKSRDARQPWYMRD